MDLKEQLKTMSNRFQLSEDQHRFFDIISKFVTIVLGVGAFFIALLTYVAQERETRAQDQRIAKENEETRKKEAKAREEEYKRRFWERQLDLYLQACKAASTIASVENPKNPEFTPARLRFQQLYYGELCIVESSRVSDCMVQFREAMLDYENNPSDERQTDVRRKALRLAQACRDSTESIFDVDLGKVNLEERKINPKR